MFHFNQCRVGWVKITNGFFRCFEIEKTENMQISHICPLFWQSLYIGNEGLDTIVFRFDSSTNHIFWERGPGILLYKEQITLAMDGYSIGSAEETEDDDAFIVFGLRYDGIRYHGSAKRTKPSISSGKYKNLGYLYIEGENDLFFDAMNKLKDRECREFIFIKMTKLKNISSR